jgi:integrase
MRDAEACGLREGDLPPRAVSGRGTQVGYVADAVPVPLPLALDPSAHVARCPREWLLTNDRGGQLGPWQLQRSMRNARANAPGPPEGLRNQDLRHYLESLLIASGTDVKTGAGPHTARLGDDDAQHQRSSVAR